MGVFANPMVYLAKGNSKGCLDSKKLHPMQTRKDKKLLLCEERASRLPPGCSRCAAKMKGNRGNENQNKGDPKQCPKDGG